MSALQLAVQRHESELGSWMLVNREPPASLHLYVSRYAGYIESERRFGQHLQTASTSIPLILNLGSPFHVGESAGHIQTHHSFVAGLHDGPTLVGADGLQHCLQIDLSPLGARRIFGVPMHEMSNRTVELGDLLGDRATALLIERLHDTPTWDERFTILDGVLTARLERAPEIPSGVVAAWERLGRHAGSVRIGSLAADLGWSNRHLIAQFREHLGLPPKMLARMLRFERAAVLLHGAQGDCLASVAQTAGYFDQAHLHRDFHQFAGITPGAFLRRRLSGMDGLVGD